MTQMQELYAKVASDATLQDKFNQIMKEAEEAGKAATEDKLLAFAKEAGFDISIQEMQGFFAELTTQQDGKLSDLEIDMVAGGKSVDGTRNIVFSVFTFGISCATASILVAIISYDGGGCERGFK